MFLRSGFSLIELMVTIAIVSILLTLGVPSFSAVLRNITLTTQANNFVAAINLARSEAIRRNTAVTLSATASNITQHHWESGWQIWVDSNGNGTLDNGELLRLFPVALIATHQGRHDHHQQDDHGDPPISGQPAIILLRLSVHPALDSTEHTR